MVDQRPVPLDQPAGTNRTHNGQTAVQLHSNLNFNPTMLLSRPAKPTLQHGRKTALSLGCLARKMCSPSPGQTVPLTLHSTTRAAKLQEILSNQLITSITPALAHSGPTMIPSLHGRTLVMAATKATRSLRLPTLLLVSGRGGVRLAQSSIPLSLRALRGR